MWRYEAIDLRTALSNGRAKPALRRGEIAAESAADARAALRAVGLQVLEIRPDRASRQVAPNPQRRTTKRENLGTGLRETIDSYFRGRRVQERADAFDALSTLLASGVPLAEAVETVADSGDGKSRPLRRVLMQIRGDLRAGKSLSESLSQHRGWFDQSEVAMVGAAEVAGTLASTLAEIASRQARSAAIAQKLVGALAYPSIVLLIGVGVALFLATRTLPQLSSILASARLDVPPLTQALMAVGSFVSQWWLAIGIAMAALAIAAGYFAPRTLSSLTPAWRGRLDRAIPLAVRRLAAAHALIRIADLLRAGVPLVETLRTVGPGYRGLRAGLGASLLAAAGRLEEGDDLSTALAADSATSGGWFDAESRRLISVGESGGDLAPVLHRLGERYERQTARLVDRLAAFLEPGAVILLAVLVGTVVMAAVLPLLKLQEIL